MVASTITLDDLAKHLGFGTVPADTTTLERVLSAANGIILPSVILENLNPYQQSVLDISVLTICQDLWRRKDSVGGAYLFADGSDITGYLPRDQFVSVAPMLIEAGLISPAVIA